MPDASMKDARKCAALPAARHAAGEYPPLLFRPAGTPGTGSGGCTGGRTHHASAAAAAPAAHAHDSRSPHSLVMVNDVDGWTSSSLLSASMNTPLSSTSGGIHPWTLSNLAPAASQRLVVNPAKSAKHSAARAAEVAASRGDLGAVFAVDGSIMGANSGKSPSTDGVAPPPRATALQRRRVSAQREAPSAVLWLAPAALWTAAVTTPSAPSRLACSGADDATILSTRMAPEGVPDGYSPPSPDAMETKSCSSRGHRATAVAAAAECLAQAANVASTGATHPGCLATSSRYLHLSKSPMRSKAAIGSTACAIPRDFLSSSPISPPSSPISSAGSCATAPWSVRVMGPDACSHANGANVTPHPPLRHSGVARQVMD
mmetsp:Transcript_10826/g.46879  ORF Transcript_10826/g.46879 Transcript_10826/m.46879 type:complete len:374 (-) Transcript_10826:704-1825(-)